MAKLKNDIEVFVVNYENTVVIPSKSFPDGIKIEAGTLENPSMTSVSIKDLISVNAISKIIKTGGLVFEDDIKDDVYETLGIRNTDEIISYKEIRNILKDDSLKNLTRIDKMKSNELLGRLQKEIIIMQSNNVVVPPIVNTIVTERYNELAYSWNNKNKTIKKLIEQNEVKQKEIREKEEYNKIQAENIEMKNTMAELMKKMEALEKANKKKDKDDKNTPKSKTDSKKDK